ncbi:putative phosphodiesterase I [Medicago truncatula]|uniref:Putative phosphodiesterase I n=1 Tax=Medicago truncatula TaxID=3880 RepID=G7KVX8_MEDTR|nr:tyrosyl-DNA phosphodiesterase 1 [Medicago truncatula]AES78905.2 tyrosyl-DNA phosphodiesterase [Medicago truncatula]RHN45661.1 putative phosphodiesterase I [Medicago truncatula]
MSFSHSQIGYLIPLNPNSEEKEKASTPKLTISDGTNIIGRNNVPVNDKRLSRKHLTITASADGTANLHVEGTNPVVVNSGNKRRKLNSKQTAAIFDGDVIELIPGHYLFKYQVSQRSPKVADNKHHERGKNSATQRHDKIAVTQKHGSSRSCEEPIRDFRVADDQIPCTFRLLRVQGLPPWANTSCVSISDVIQGDILVAVLSNYMVDVDWLVPACPALSKVPHVLVLHGESDERVACIKRSKPKNWILHKPPLPISFGTHHSKAMFLVYPRGVRVIIHTANLIYVDWNNKSQGLWMQDFPWKDQNSPSKGSRFENDLVEYLSALKWPEFSVNLPSLGNFSICPSFFKKFDYSDAMVRLIASVPGYHSGNGLKKWGHMKLRSVLQECTFDKEFKKSPLVYQFSSLGSLDEKWMVELASSMSAGLSEDKVPLGMGEPQIIWPTVEEVRCSIEGYAAGSAIPSPMKNVEKAFLKKYWAKWKANHTGRTRAMPHIKTFARYNNQNLAWFCLTSSNLSKAAWGALQKNNSQLMIRSYELGVLFLPSLLKPGCGFSCTSNVKQSKDKSPAQETSKMKKTKLVTLTAPTRDTTHSSSEVIIQLPVPYELPPLPYSSEDVPWSWDRRYFKKDDYGQVWPRM